ncbi:MAG TPA: IS1595 family transposase [Candidatus Paceibacterota bacterium]
MPAPRLKWSKLTARQTGRLAECFAFEMPAGTAARAVGVHRHTAARVYREIRRRLARECERESILDGEVEADESYFGGHRKGKRGRGAAGKVIVFGLLKRRGRVYTRPVPNVSKATLRLVIKAKVPEGSTIYSDSLASYDGLITEGYRHYRIDHGREFARGRRNHINGIESFWGYAKTKLRRYYGISRGSFFLYLKEMEYRFNHRRDDLAKRIKALLARRPG